MTVRSLIARVLQQKSLNFLLTNRIPRRSATRLMGWLSKIEQPLVRDVSIGIWRLLSDLDLSEAKKTRFKSLHDCFVRELKEGARPIDPRPEMLTSPCDAIVGASGRIVDGVMLQVKGSGLGLFIVRSVVERHGGRVFAESAGEGMGSTFTIVLPRA